jgi:hypothetical protein
MLCKDRSDAVAKLRSQERVWKWERAGWILMALFLVAGLADVLGPTPRSKRLVRQGSFLHLVKQTPPAESPVRLEIQARASAEKDLVVRIKSACLEKSQVQSIVPSPSRIITAQDWRYYVFAAAAPNETVTAVFRLKNNGTGTAPVNLEVAEGELVSFNQVGQR